MCVITNKNLQSQKPLILTEILNYAISCKHFGSVDSPGVQWCRMFLTYDICAKILHLHCVAVTFHCRQLAIYNYHKYIMLWGSKKQALAQTYAMIIHNYVEWSFHRQRQNETSLIRLNEYKLVNILLIIR